MNPWLRAYVCCVVFSVFGIFVQRLTGQDAVWIARVMSIVTLGSALAAVLTSLRISAVQAGVVLVVGAGAEIIGLYTGIPFGRYEYTAAWWPTITLPNHQQFPVMLPFAWLMMVAASWGTVALMRLSGRFMAAASAGLLAAAADLPLEYAVTRKLGYWVWLDSTPGLPAPLLNSVGWFLVASMGAYALRNTSSPTLDRTSAIVLTIHVFFTLIISW